MYRCRLGGYTCAVKVVNIKAINETALKMMYTEISFLETLQHDSIQVEWWSERGERREEERGREKEREGGREGGVARERDGGGRGGEGKKEREGVVGTRRKPACVRARLFPWAPPTHRK